MNATQANAAANAARPHIYQVVRTFSRYYVNQVEWNDILAKWQSAPGYVPVLVADRRPDDEAAVYSRGEVRAAVILNVGTKNTLVAYATPGGMADAGKYGGRVVLTIKSVKPTDLYLVRRMA